MSCLPELTYTIYVDGELPPDERRALESHLVGCRRCRELVVALREEAALLGDVLLERQREPLALPAAAAPVRALALGFGPTLAAAVATTMGVGWLLEALRPEGLDWITPLGLRGAYDMSFDLIFMLRDRAPAAFEVALAVAAMASVSALLTFALTALSRRWSGPGLLTLAALIAVLAPAPSSQAHFGFHEHRDFNLPAGEVHDGTLVASGRNVNIDGDVAGDLIALAQRLTVRGEVRGNLIAATRNLDLSGKVTGSVHTATARGNLSGEVGGNLYAIGEYLTLAGSGHVGRDAAVAGENFVMEGSVGRDLYLAHDWAEVRGRVARDVHTWGEHLAFLDGAAVGGDVETSLSPEDITVAPGAAISGETRHRPHLRHPRRSFARFAEPRFYLWMALHIAAGFAVGMVLHALAPGIFGVHLATARAFFRSLGIGFVAAVATPVALALLAATLVGIPLALMGAAVYASALYVALVLVAALIGASLVHPRDDAWTSFGLALLAGLAILVIASHTPFVGGLIRGIAVLTGLGLLVQRARSAWLSPQRAGA